MENASGRDVSSDKMWTTVEIPWTRILGLTCMNGQSSPIHRPYDIYEKILSLLLGGGE